MVDLVKMKSYLFKDETLGAEYEIAPIPAELDDQCKKMRAQMLEELATIDESNEAFMMKVLEAPDTLSEDEIHAVIRQGVCSNKINPVLCGTAFKNKGIQPLLEAITRWMPSPLDRGIIKGLDANTEEELILQPSDEGPLAALVFKVVTDPYVGRLTFYAFIQVY